MSGQVPACGIRDCAQEHKWEKGSRRQHHRTGQLTRSERVVLVPGGPQAHLAPSVVYSGVHGWVVSDHDSSARLVVELDDGTRVDVERVHCKRWRTYNPPPAVRNGYRRPAVVDAVDPFLPLAVGE